MSFKEYFIPSKRNLSLTGVVLASQLITFFAAATISIIIVPGFVEGSALEGNPVGDAILFVGIFLGNYAAACSCDWWINEYLK